VVLLELARTADRVLDRVAVPRQRDARRELDRPVECREVVGERVARARPWA
jgi:hypothetical protein